MTALLEGSEKLPAYSPLNRAAMLAAQFAEIKDRRDDAITALAARFSLGVPDPRARAFPKPIEGSLYYVGLLERAALARESVVALANRVDDLEKRLAAAESGPKKGAKS